MKILIIDDEPLVRRSLQKAFATRKDYLIEEAEDGFAGIEKWKYFKPDLVMLDVLMPRLSGPEVLVKIRPDKGPAKVVLMSAYSGDYNLETAQKLGADLFISKPFEDIFNVVKISEGIVK